jgi:hypothetical protein
LTIKFTQSTRGLRREVLGTWLLALGFFIENSSSLDASAKYQLPTTKSRFYDLICVSLIAGCRCAVQSAGKLLTRLHSGPHTSKTSKVLIKITLRLCSYINLFSCQISSSIFRSAAWAASFVPVIGTW